MKFIKFPVFIFALLALGLTSCKDDLNEDDLIDLREVKLFVSSNTQPFISVYDFSDDAEITLKNIQTPYTDADGIVYVDGDDMVYQLSRSDNKIYGYKNIEDLVDGEELTPFSSSTSDFVNGRAMIRSGNKLVVAEDAAPANNNTNKLLVYSIDDDDENITLINTFTVPINLWGIEYEDDRLYAIVDNSDSLAVFNDFFDNTTDGMLVPDVQVRVAGITRTHGITISDGDDLLILTDVGDATSDSDGALIFIEDFKDKIEEANNNTGSISVNDQRIIEGANSMLGNPVDVAYDKVNERVYVSERAKDGGRIMIFQRPTNASNAAPIFNELSPGASAVFLSTGL